jgi:5-methylcytosine-specific restriction endonuclease McrA
MKLKTLAEQNNYTCYWCNTKFKLDELSRDHINPVNKGKHRRNKNGKCVLACKLCNQQRGNLPFFMFKELKDNYENKQ